MSIKDDNGTPITIGMKVGCRNESERRSEFRRGLTLTGYEPEAPQPYVTDAGRFDIAIKDHQPDMEAWIEKHTS